MQITPNPRRVRVCISNPLPGGSRYTSLRNAERFVRRGLARWTGTKLMFIESDTRDMAIVSAEIGQLRKYLAYDRVARPMTLREIAAIPVICPEKLIMDRGRSRHERN